eukprot:471003-Pleurochrysis_carterae.AAC.5
MIGSTSCCAKSTAVMPRSSASRSPEIGRRSPEVGWRCIAKSKSVRSKKRVATASSEDAHSELMRCLRNWRADGSSWETSLSIRILLGSKYSGSFCSHACCIAATPTQS